MRSSRLHSAAAWRFSSPSSLEALEALLADADGDYLIVAGGQSLLPGLLNGTRQATHLIDITRIDELRMLDAGDDGVRIGAAVTLTELLESDLPAYPALVQALGCVGTRPIRNRSTVGGTLAWADPRAELRLLLLALRAEIRTTHRAVPAVEFMRGRGEQELMKNEVILGVALPAQAGSLQFGELMDRNSAGRAVVLVAVETKAGALRITVGGLVDRPVASPWVGRQDAAGWLASLAAAYPPLDDPFHSWRYRLAVAGALIVRCLES